MVGSCRRRCKGLQGEPRKSQRADDAERRGEEREPHKSEDSTGEHQEDRPPETSHRSGGQGQGRRQDKVREGLHATLERRDLHRPERITRNSQRPSHSCIVPAYKIQRQAMYQLRYPNNILNTYKDWMYARSKLLLVKKKAHTLKELLVRIRSNVNKALITRALVVARRRQDLTDLSRCAASSTAGSFRRSCRLWIAVGSCRRSPSYPSLRIPLTDT